PAVAALERGHRAPTAPRREPENRYMTARDVKQPSTRSARVGTIPPTGRIPELLALALQHHRSSQLAEAESRYREILAIDPKQVETLHLLGVIAHQTGRNKQAVDTIGKAIAL